MLVPIEQTTRRQHQISQPWYSQRQ